MSKSATEVEFRKFTGTDAELFEEIDDWAQKGMAVAAITSQGNLRYLYFRRIMSGHLYEQQRIDVSADVSSISDVIHRESSVGWNFATAHCGKDNRVYLFFNRPVAREIEEKD